MTGSLAVFMSGSVEIDSGQRSAECLTPNTKPAIDYRQRLVDYIPDLRRYARSLTFNRDDADELLQDCLERALSRLHLLRDDTNIRSWAFTVMHNVYCNWVKRMKRQPARKPFDEALNVARVQAYQHVSTEFIAVIGALRQLPDPQREIITLIAIEEVSYQEAAETLGIPMGTVMSRLARARERLRELFIDASARATS